MAFAQNTNVVLQLQSREQELWDCFLTAQTNQKRHYLANNFVKFKNHEQLCTTSTRLSVIFFFSCSSSKYCLFMCSMASLWGTYTSTHLFEDGTGATGWRHSECQAPDESTPATWESCFSHPSGKWNNERNIPTVRVP